MKKNPSILIVGVVPSLTWLVARCVKRAGRVPTILCWHKFSPMRFTGDCKDYIEWSNLSKASEKLHSSALQQVVDICKRKSIDMVVAADYDAVLLLAERPGDHAIPCSVIPPASAMVAFNNKWTLSRLLEQLELPYPQSEYISCEDELLATRIPFPIITKPLDKWASVGFQIHWSFAELKSTLTRGKLTSTFPLIAQSHVPGWDVGASFLAKDGRLAAYSIFQSQKRGERVFYDENRVRSYLEKFIEVTDYGGVGHFDMRYNPVLDEYRILELNPRFWASLLYAANAGLNYPDLLIELNDWDDVEIRKAIPGKVRLPPYERAMMVSNMIFSNGYEKFTGAKL